MDAIYIVRDFRPKWPREEYSSESQIEDEISIKFRIFDARRARGSFARERADWSFYEGTITSADKPFPSVIEPRSEEHRNSNGSLCNPMLRRREGNVFSRLRFSPSALFSSLPAFLSSLLPVSVGRNKSGLANTGRYEVLLHSRNRSVGNRSRLFIKRSLLPQQSIILFLRSGSPSSPSLQPHYSKVYMPKKILEFLLD